MSDLRAILIVSDHDWQAGSWLNDQPDEVRRIAHRVTGAKDCLGNDPATTRYILVGTTKREFVRAAYARLVERGIAVLPVCALCRIAGGDLVDYDEAGEPEKAHPECVKQLHEIDPEGRR